jgi:hypothetical protein
MNITANRRRPTVVGWRQNPRVIWVCLDLLTLLLASKQKVEKTSNFY